MDVDYLSDLFAGFYRADKLSYREGYYWGRIEEYISQNAISPEIKNAARRVAMLAVYGDGPATGAQC